MLESCSVDTVEVKTNADLNGLKGLIIPGGESTTIAKLIDIWDLREPIRSFVANGGAVWGTCAGMIMLAGEIEEGEPEPLKLLDFSVKRNFFGRQKESFESDLNVGELGDKPFRAVFIRAPAATKIGAGVDVIAKLEDGTAVGLRQGRLMATAFHPELTDDTRFHKMFVNGTMSGVLP